MVRLTHHDKINNASDKNIRFIRAIPSLFLVWYDDELKELIYAKKCAHFIWKASNLLSDHIKNIACKLMLNIAVFWSYMKSVHKCNVILNNVFLNNRQA